MPPKSKILKSGADHEGSYDVDSCSSDSTDTADEFLSGHMSRKSIASHNDDSSVDSSVAEEHDEEEAAMGKKAQSSRRWKRVVVLLLFVTSILITASTYIFVQREDKDEFEQSYADDVERIQETLITKVVSLKESLSQMADSLTTEHMSYGASSPWPYFTISQYEIKGAHILMDSQCESVLFTPFVKKEQRAAWEAFSVSIAPQWIQESKTLYQLETSKWGKGSPETNTSTVSAALNVTGGERRSLLQEDQGKTANNHRRDVYENDFFDTPPEKRNASTAIYTVNEDEEIARSADRSLFAPIWMTSPPPKDASIVNFDMFSIPSFARSVFAMVESYTDTALPNINFHVTAVTDLNFITTKISGEDQIRMHQIFNGSNSTPTTESPHSVFFVPVRKDFTGQNPPEVVGVISLVMSWHNFLSSALSEADNGIHAVLVCPEGKHYTFLVEKTDVLYLGEGDMHEVDYNTMAQEFQFTEAHSELGSEGFKIRLYPTSTYSKEYDSAKPELFAAALMSIFLLVGGVFLVYVESVERQQHMIMATALRTSDIVASLFPARVRRRILKDAEEQAQKEYLLSVAEKSNRSKHNSIIKKRLTLLDFLDSGDKEGNKDVVIKIAKPIADHYPEATIMFADLVGFTAWSSLREPAHVFILLETVYQSFDRIANQRGVFKVETIGDCYLAVCGVPDPRKDHAIVMGKFATDCLNKFNELTKQLERRLGPDTGDLAMRTGLHSGPVTAGVIRGERARFQLFGDTVNTAARMESNGKPNLIQISPSTAELLMEAGKAHWLEARKDKIVAKGKGEMQTYWLKRNVAVVGEGGESDDENVSMQPKLTIGLSSVSIEDAKNSKLRFKDRQIRLIGWNSELLTDLVKRIVARRQAQGQPSSALRRFRPSARKGLVIDEIEEIIEFPEYDIDSMIDADVDHIQLGSDVEREINELVRTIAVLYKEHPFHNFEHASHVAMSLSKLMRRIGSVNSELQRSKHHYGIATDPLLQFACIFSALIHDVDHPGVPNSQLVKEGSQLAKAYGERSVAEQNSIELAWDMLMNSRRFDSLVRTLCVTEEEFKRFRQLLVNCVMATDIMDKELKELRDSRWEKAFQPENSGQKSGEESGYDRVNRKSTIVVEYLMQASDVAHTMQHWHIYQKWNARLFQEMYQAYKEGRATQDPSEFWYDGELGFFDFYVIPLARKLKECGVLGVRSAEYLSCAEQNRHEFALKGKELVEDWLDACK